MECLAIAGSVNKDFLMPGTGSQGAAEGVEVIFPQGLAPARSEGTFRALGVQEMLPGPSIPYSQSRALALDIACKKLANSELRVTS